MRLIARFFGFLFATGAIVFVLGAIAIAGVVLLTRFHPDRREPELPGWSEPGEDTLDSPPASQG